MLHHKKSGVAPRELKSSTPILNLYLQDDDDETTGGRADEPSQVVPRTNKRAVIEDSSDEDE